MGAVLLVKACTVIFGEAAGATWAGGGLGSGCGGAGDRAGLGATCFTSAALPMFGVAMTGAGIGAGAGAGGGGIEPLGGPY